MNFSSMCLACQELPPVSSCNMVIITQLQHLTCEARPCPETQCPSWGAPNNMHVMLP